LFGGVFDRFPNLKIVLGHMGEGLPFMRWRFDSRFAVYSHGINLKRRPSEYIGRNILITTTGVCSPAALVGAIEEVGVDSVDHPYESATVAANFIEQAPLSDKIREKICYRNAERLLKLKPP
jgi:2,3-dihydroxybenzoate decarboxylase